jgi:hypothetical protein
VLPAPAPATEAALPGGAPASSGVGEQPTEEAIPPLPMRPDDLTNSPTRRARKPAQREAPDDWKKNIPIFGGG